MAQEAGREIGSGCDGEEIVSDELTHAVNLANKVLDRISADPDDDLATLARQFLRAQERLTRLRAENEALRGALKPFAEFADIIAKERPGWDHDGFGLLPSMEDPRLRLSLAPFRRAAALKP